MPRKATEVEDKRNIERELRLSNYKSRKTMIEREKAMETARNPGNSKFGECLATINNQDDSALTSELGRIDSEIKKMKLQIKQRKQLFIKTSQVLNHNPMIIVERMPSRDVIHRSMDMYHPQYHEIDTDLPHYMWPLRSKMRPVSAITTIDAFVVRRSKKRNIWEEALNEPPQFESAVRPYSRLSARELKNLQFGLSSHKPKITPEPLSRPREESVTEIAESYRSNGPDILPATFMATDEPIPSEQSTPLITHSTCGSNSSKHIEMPTTSVISNNRRPSVRSKSGTASKTQKAVGTIDSNNRKLTKRPKSAVHTKHTKKLVTFNNFKLRPMSAAARTTRSIQTSAIPALY